TDMFFISAFLMMQVFLYQTLLMPKIIIDAGFQIRYIYGGRRAWHFSCCFLPFHNGYVTRRTGLPIHWEPGLMQPEQ
ncbi:hypothetical protein, partial [Akkermansia sp.]|uniref:hypothetical protein n=1 Tax=Akkermansia sp. TaxID=1872421 RepID=UPI003AAD5089